MIDPCMGSVLGFAGPQTARSPPKAYRRYWTPGCEIELSVLN